MKSFGNNASYQPPPYSQHQEDEDYEWNHQSHYEPSNEEMEYEWSNEHRYYPSNEEMNYEEEYGYLQESFDPNLYCHDSGVENHQEDYEIKSMFRQILDGLRSEKEEISNLNAKFEGLMTHVRGLDNQVAFHSASLNAEGEDEEVSNDEDTVQEKRVCDVFPKECNGVDEHQENCMQQSIYEEEEEITQFQEEKLNEDVLDAQSPFTEEIEKIPKDEDMTPEDEVTDVFHMAYEIIVKHQDDPIYAQQQSQAGEEVKEIIQLHENALDEDALASIVAVINEKTLRYNNASTNETNKEEDEVFQLYELPQKELHKDEVVGPRVPGSPTPRSKYPQGPRKKLGWRIKHKWKEKLHNV